MGMQIVGPKMKIRKEDESLPFFYLLGPGKGTEPWHTKMCDELKEKIKGNFLVYYSASPDGPISNLSGLYKGELTDLSQIQLEIQFQRHAGIISPHGCIIAWLPSESPKNSHEEKVAYGRTTSRHLSQWFARIEKDLSVGFAWGGDSNFPGLKEMCDELPELLGDNRELPFYSHMSNLISHAESIAFNRAATVSVKNYHRLPSF